MRYPTEDEPSNHAHGDDLEDELKQAIKEPSKHVFKKEKLKDSGLTELKFSALNLVGREEQMDVLKVALERFVPSGRREFVLLSGQSGTGKTLLSSWAQKRAKSIGAVVAQQECETATREHPYAGISSLGNQLCSFLEENDFYKSSKSKRITCMESCSKAIMDTLDAVEHCVNDKYLETSDGETYGFVHGKIQESVTNSASREELEGLQWTIGLLLSEELNLEDTATNQIFVVTNLLNDAWTADKDIVRERLIELNLKAAERAIGFSAYSTAAHYAGMGIRYWGKKLWSSNCSMGVALYSIAAKSEHSIGHWEKKAQEYCNDVLERNDLSVIEKSALYGTLMDLKCNPLKQHEEALDIALQVLQQLGCKFPKYSLMRGSSSLKSLFKLRRPPTKEEIAKLPMMDDPVKLMAANMMSKAFPLTHYTKSYLLAVLLSVRMVRWTLEFGIADDSPSAFAGLGMMINQILGDFENGNKYCEIALAILDKTPTRKKDANATLLAVMGLAFSKPIPLLLDPLLNGYKFGMAEGDIEMAMWNMNSYLTMQLYCGKLLKHVNKDFEVYVPQMKALGQSEPHDSTVPSWNVAMELADHVDQRARSMMVEGFIRDNVGESTEMFLPVHTLFLHAILGQYDLGATCAKEKVVKNLKKMQAIGMSYVFVCFYAGISFYAMARKTGRYKKHANSCGIALHNAVKKGNPNAVHHVKFLDAEHEALLSRSKAPLELYQEAISFAGRLGFLQDVALANERYAELLLNSSDPDLGTEETSFRIQESIKYYSEWGAERKVRLLKEQYADIINRT